MLVLIWPLQNIPWQAAAAVLPAFLLEAVFYGSLASERVRTRLERLPPVLFAALLTVSAILPYCLATLAFGTFQWRALASIAAQAKLARIESPALLIVGEVVSLQASLAWFNGAAHPEKPHAASMA